MAKKRFCLFQSRKKGQIQVLLRYLQLLNKNQTLLIKMDTEHNIILNLSKCKKANKNCDFFFSSRKQELLKYFSIFFLLPTSSNIANMLYLNYYLCGAFCVVCVCEKLFLLHGFGEQTSRILEFKPEGLEG